MLPLFKKDIGKKKLIIDPLKRYVTLDGKGLREFPWFKPVINSMLKGRSEVTLLDLNNLLSIVVNKLIDMSLR